jgi:hypothetical protein
MRVKSFDLFLSESEEERTYSFDELSPEAKKKALEKNRDINIDYTGWEDLTIDDFKEEVKEDGINDLEVTYTGFHSQGDGASFTSNDIDTRKIFNAAGIKSDGALNMEVDDERSKGVNKEFYDLLDTMEDIGQLERNRIKPEEIRVTVERINSRYYHENTVRANVEIWDEPDGWEEPPNFTSELEDKITDYIRGLCRKLYRYLEEDYEYQTSDEAVQETIEANNYKFDERGNIV